MQYTKVNPMVFTVPATSPIYADMHRLASSIADDCNVHEVLKIEFAMTDKQASIKFKTAGITDALSGIASGGLELIQAHPAITAGLVTYILAKSTGSESAIGDAVEAFIWGYLMDDPMAGIGAGMTDGIIGSIMGGFGGAAAGGFLKSMFGGSNSAPVTARSHMKSHFAADDNLNQAAQLIGQLQSSGIQEPQQIVGALQENMGGSFSQIVSEFMSDFSTAASDFFSGIFDGGANQEKAKQIIDSNPKINETFKEKQKEEEQKNMNSQQPAATTGTPANVAPEQAQTTMTQPLTNPQDMAQQTTATAAYTNPFRSIFAQRN